VDTQSNKYNSSHNYKINKFIPHIALVYAPEMYHDYVNQRTNETNKTTLFKTHASKVFIVMEYEWNSK
jgi:hypothetical protein